MSLQVNPHEPPSSFINARSEEIHQALLQQAMAKLKPGQKTIPQGDSIMMQYIGLSEAIVEYLDAVWVWARRRAAGGN